MARIDRRHIGSGTPTPSNLLLVVPMRLFCFGSLVVLDMMCGHFLVFVLDIKEKRGKIDI